MILECTPSGYSGELWCSVVHKYDGINSVGLTYLLSKVSVFAYFIFLQGVHNFAYLALWKKAKSTLLKWSHIFLIFVRS